MREFVESTYRGFRKMRRAFDSSRGWYRIDYLEDGDGGEEAVVYIYDSIGFWGVEAEAFVKEFDAITSKSIVIRINSPGGSVFDGMAIYNAIKRHPATVRAVVDGLAASMASLIALAADTVEMSRFAMFMIHNPWGIAIGDAEDMRAEAEILEKLTGQAVAIYADSSNLTAGEVRSAMTATTWYTAEEAEEAGFAVVVDPAPDEDDETAPEARAFDLSIFKNVPRNLVQDIPRLHTRRSVEQTLRDAGLSRQDAKALLKGGYGALSLRDPAAESAYKEAGALLDGVISKFRN